MRVIGSTPIWNEPFGELVLRWFHRQSPELRERIGGPAEAQLRVERRAARLMELAGIAPARALSSPREWETRWNARAQWDRLVAHADRRGWDVVIDPDDTRGLRWTATALAESDRKTILVADQALEVLAAQASLSGCLLGLRAEDLAPLALAIQLYGIEAARLGNPPQEWVDELGALEFTRRVLGLPFHPLVFQLLDNKPE
ncbi:MAG: hypothetical protein PWP23_3218 [Candidatus Sumerlaeota bacterium]|nr:hypothetical protein [Candidatus Sumerlaeota bacterium]